MIANRRSSPRRLTTGLALLAALLFTSSGTAGENLHLGGFGTLGYSCFSSDSADFVLNVQPAGPGRSGRCDPRLDSLLAVQADLQLAPALEFGLQATSDYNADGDFAPEITVAQLRWQFSDASTLRLGRTHNPVFLHSESRNVRYAMPWVRPPLEVYGLSPTYTFDGAEILHQQVWSGWHAEFQGSAAVSEIDNPRSNASSTDTADVEQVSVGLTLERAALLLKAGYVQGRVSYTTADLNTLFSALRSLGPAGTALAADLDIDDSRYDLFALGARYETDAWLVQAEYGYRPFDDSFFRDMQGTYLTVGRHFGEWTPYATLAQRWTRGPDSDPRAGVYASVVDAVLASTRFDSRSVSLGVSRPVHTNAILKWQLDWIMPDDNSWGLYSNHGPDYDYAHPDGDYLMSINLDFVF